jgi:acetyl-CoA carboxylase carboxyltransferase component
MAAQRQRRDVDDLIARTPADGLVAGIGRINGDPSARPAPPRCCPTTTPLAGTQGVFGHRKKDRLFELIERMRLPTVFFAEGGGAAGDTDYPTVSSLEVRAFKLWAALSGGSAHRGGQGPLLCGQRR